MLDLDLSPRQKKIIGNGLTLAALGVVVVFVALAFTGMHALLKLLAPAITPVFAGMFLAMFFRPYLTWWRGLIKNPKLALTVMLLSVLVPLVVLLWFGGASLAGQASELWQKFPSLVRKALEWIGEYIPSVHDEIKSMDIASILNSVADPVKDLGAMLKGCLSSVAGWIISLMFFFYFLNQPDMRGEDYVKEMTFLKDETRAFLVEQINAFLDILVSFFQRQVVICLIEGVLYGLGFMLVGLPSGFVLGFALGAINLIPMFGTVCCLPVAVSIAYLGDGGSSLRAVGVILVWLTGQIMDGYLITPKIQGAKTGLGYAGVLFSFFFWYAVFDSLIGLLLAIPLSAFCVVFWGALKSKYIKPIV